VDRNQGGEAADTYLRILASTVLVGVPAGLGISLVADQVVHLALGPRWLAAIDLIRVLGVGGIGLLFGLISTALLTAHAKLQSVFWIQTASMVIRLAATIFFVAWMGLLGAAWAWTIAMGIENLLCVWLACQHFHVSVTMLAQRVWRPLVAGCLMAAVLALAGIGWSALPDGGEGAVISLMVAILLGATTYVVSLGLMWLASGRPAGAETDLGAYAQRTIRRSFG
jgi:O-antigen/teichoic acid export membrane protein